MNKKSASPLNRGNKGRREKILRQIFTTVIFLLLYCLSFLLVRNLDVSYCSVNDWNRVKTLMEDGYYVVSYETSDVSYKNGDNLNVEVLIVELINEKENISYYFKSKKECNDYIAKLQEYTDTTEYIIKCYIDNYQVTTSEEELELKLDSYRELKEKAEAEALAKKQKEEAEAIAKRIKYQAVSRHEGRKINAPMASYVFISSYYGPRNGSIHTGVDFAAPQGTELYAWKDGVITFAGWSGNYGYFIAIEHADGTISRYAHCSKIIVEEGQEVKAYDTIGYVGSTGRSTGPHLHFEILIEGKFVNPLNYLY